MAETYLVAGGHGWIPRLVAARRRVRLLAAVLAAAVFILLAYSSLGASEQVTFRSVPASSSTSTGTGAGTAPDASVSAWQAGPGAHVRVRATGFQPGSAVGISAFSHPGPPAVVVTANAGGDVTAVVTVPVTAKPGWQAINLSGNAPQGQALVESVGVNVSH